MRRFSAVPVVVLVGALFPVASAAAAVPGLAGELLLPTESVQLERSCSTTGTSTISYSVSGVAFGPYPGTFSESGTLSVGSPQNLPLVLPGSLEVESAGPVTGFQASFTIDSPVGTVTGTKTLPVQDPSDQGSCLIAPTAIADIGFGPEPCTDVDNATARIPTARYDATIQTAAESQHDSGGSIVFVEQFKAKCIEFNPNQTSFQEEFYETQPVNTPGHVTGGGTIGPAPLAGVAFGFQADSTGETFKGECTVVDHDTGMQVKCVDVTGFVQTGNTVEITGDAEVNGVGTTYRIVTDDNGEPNQGLDDFSIQTGSGYSVGGPATEGNVQVH